MKRAKRRLTLRTLLIRATTPKGLRGVRLNFDTGLNVIRAENSMGKSTCMNSIAYALGLDAMITTSHSPFLPSALTDHLLLGGKTETIISSEIFLEVENARAEPLTIRRWVTGGQDRNLVNTWNGHVVSEPDAAAEQTDYYVRSAGAATAPRGFHSRLVEYVGWSLPMVPRYKGQEVPLYIETIFPLMFVEQKRGWASLRARFPTHFGIRDVRKRAFEFLLDLDAYHLAVEKQSLQRQLDETRNAWRENVVAVEALANAFGAIVRFLPESPVAAWPPQVTPRLVVPRGQDLIDVREVLRGDETRLEQLRRVEVPLVSAVANERQADLVFAEREISEFQHQATTLVAEIEMEAAELDANHTRLEELRDELRRLKDTQKLVRLGSEHAISALTGLCPTCNQTLDSDVFHEQSALTMPLAENLKFVAEQIDVFELVEAESKAQLSAKRKLLGASNRRVAELRSRIRALRETLVSDPRLPSVADIEDRISLEANVQSSRKLLDALEPLLERFAALAERWAELQEMRAAFGDSELSAEDERKLAALETSFRQQLKAYDFRSDRPSAIAISRDDYQPESDGFDVEADASASDMIRVIWSYMLGLLEVARRLPTNHLGLLLFDEPRQQSTKKVSFQQLMKRAALAHRHGQQVIFATSEELETIEEALEETPHTLRVFKGNTLGPLKS